MTEFEDIFRRATGLSGPYAYQRRLATDEWPELLNVPTGLGKTAAVGLAWLYKRLIGDPDTPRRLVYCLPMRVLVEQTHASLETWTSNLAPTFEAEGLTPPTVHLLMGGDQDTRWVERPEQPAVIVGTQDMLLSRALMRGYGMSRYMWPVHFALLHNDALWVFDEVQLMGPALVTSAQLEGFRRRADMPAAASVRSLWLSATLNPHWLNTVDLRPYHGELRTLSLSSEDKRSEAVRTRHEAMKTIDQASTQLTAEHQKKSGRKAYAESLAAEVLERHSDAGDTLVVLNTVERAQALYNAVRKAGLEAPLLVHARFRGRERAAIEARLLDDQRPATVVIATQAIEAGVDLTSRCLFTELAPWSSLAQRLGRCNRYGEHRDAAVYWIDITEGEKTAPPYEPKSLAAAREQLRSLDSASPSALPAATESQPARHTLRRRDFFDLFNTEPDLSGFDVDVSPYIRDTGTPQVQVFWRDFEQHPDDDEPRPQREELCPVSMGQLHDHLRKEVHGHVWDPLAAKWQRVRNPVPGMTLMLRARDGGYDPERGFVAGAGVAVDPIADEQTEAAREETYAGDSLVFIDRFVGLTEHLGDVEAEAQALGEGLGLDADSTRMIATAGRWHDVGKAHEAFQTALRDFGEPPEADGEIFWAKSPGSGRLRYRTVDENGDPQSRPRFRHELASMLAWLEHGDRDSAHDLIAYLIAAHHGKVRMGLRSLPEERQPPEPDRRFARGIWEGDSLPAVRLNGAEVPETKLRLDVMELGEGAMGPSWTDRAYRLLDELGPFRLAWLEALVRIADWRASAREAQQ